MKLYNQEIEVIEEVENDDDYLCVTFTDGNKIFVHKSMEMYISEEGTEIL